MQTIRTTAEARKSEKEKSMITQERKYFEIFPDMNLSSAPTLVWVNEAQMRSGFSFNRQLPFCGLNMQTVPVITFDRSKKRGGLKDAYGGPHHMWFVSDRLKQLMEQVDQHAFDFAATQVDYSNFEKPGQAYWLCNLKRQLDCIDDENSKFTLYDEVDFKAYKALIAVKMRAEVIGDSHAFRLAHKYGTEIFDDVFVRAMTAAKIRAWRFELIQQV